CFIRAAVGPRITVGTSVGSAAGGKENQKQRAYNDSHSNIASWGAANTGYDMATGCSRFDQTVACKSNPRRSSCFANGHDAKEKRVSIDKMGVIGGGLMGSGIAEVCARTGIDVTIAEVNPQAAQAAHQRIDSSLNRAEARGKIDSS